MTLKRLNALLVVTALSVGAVFALSTPADAYVRGCGWHTGWHSGWHRGWHRWAYAGAPIVASDYVAAPVVATDYVAAPAPRCTTGCGRTWGGSCGWNAGWGGWGRTTYGGGGLFGGLLPF